MRVHVEIAREVVDQATQRVRSGGHVGNLHLDGLASGDGLAKRDAVVGASDAHLKHALAHAKVGCRNVNAGDGQRVDGHFHALALAAQQVFRVETHVREFQARMACAAAAHHVGHFHQLESRSVHRHQECGQAGIFIVVRVGDRDDVSILRAVGVGDKPLLAVQQIGAVFLADGGGVNVGAGAAGLLGKREAREHGLILELVHQLGLDLRRAVFVEDAPIQVGRIMKMHAHAARAAAELFLHLEDFELV